MDPRSRAKLVLIQGSPRSGTTWLAKIFDSHPDVLYRHEPDSSHVDRSLPFVPELDEVARHVARAAAYLEELKGIRTLKSAGSLPMFAKSYRGPVREMVHRGLLLGARLAQPAWSRLRRSAPPPPVPDLMRSHGADGVCHVVKSVDSLARTYLYSQADPAAYIVHIVRHPCAYVASSLRGARLHLMSPEAFVNTQARMSQAKRRQLTRERLAAMSLEEQLASLWMLQNEKVIEEMQGCGNYRLLVYEDLCRAPEAVSRSLFEFVGLDWSAQTADFLRQSENYSGQEERYFQVVRNPLVAAYKWESELTVEQKERILALVRDSVPGQLYVEGAGERQS